MAIGLDDLYGGRDTLEEVIILPFDSGRQNTGTWQGFSLPAGYTWSDFEYIEAFAGNSAADVDILASDAVTKEQIAQNPTSFRGYASFQSSSGTQYQASYRATGETTAEWLTAGNGVFQMLKGYTRRYASRNLSAIVNVNGGANIAVNSRYEIDIATELGQDYLGRDLIVQAELYAAGNEYTGWAEMPLRDFYNNGAYYSHGVKAYSDGQKIHVYTAGYGKGVSSSNVLIHYDATNPWKNIQIFNAPCRVKVWKIDQFLTPTYKGGAGKTVLYDGNTVTHGNDVLLSDSILKYDDIRIYWDFNAYGSMAVTIEPEELLNTNWSEAGRITTNPTSTSSNAIYVGRTIPSDSTETSLRVQLSLNTWSAGGIYRVVGIKYQ